MGETTRQGQRPLAGAWKWDNAHTDGSVNQWPAVVKEGEGKRYVGSLFVVERRDLLVILAAPDLLGLISEAVGRSECNCNDPEEGAKPCWNCRASRSLARARGEGDADA